MSKEKFLIDLDPLRAETLDDLISLYGNIFGEKKAALFRKRCVWQYGKNPFKPKTQAANIAIIHNNKMVGHTGIVHVPYKIGSETVLASWTCDLMARKVKRVLSIVLPLANAIRTASDFPMGFGISTPTKRLFTRRYQWRKIRLNSIMCRHLKVIGIYRHIIPVNKHSRVLRKANIIKKKASLLVHYFTARGGLSVCKSANRNHRISFVEKFDPRFDRFWDEIKGEYPISVVRNCEYLDWRYGRENAHGPKIIVAEVRGKINGFAVLDKLKWRGMMVGQISELLFHRADSHQFSALLSFIENFFLREGVDALMTEGFPIDIRRWFKASGFIEDQEARSLIYENRTGRFSETMLEDVDNWLTTPGDSDFSYAREAERCSWRPQIRTP